MNIGEIKKLISLKINNEYVNVKIPKAVSVIRLFCEEVSKDWVPPDLDDKKWIKYEGATEEKHQVYWVKNGDKKDSIKMAIFCRLPIFGKAIWVDFLKDELLEVTDYFVI